MRERLVGGSPWCARESQWTSLWSSSPSTCLLECHTAHQVVQQTAVPTEPLRRHLFVSFNRNKSLEHKDAQSTVQCTLCNYQELLASPAHRVYYSECPQSASETTQGTEANPQLYGEFYTWSSKHWSSIFLRFSQPFSNSSLFNLISWRVFSISGLFRWPPSISSVPKSSKAWKVGSSPFMSSWCSCGERRRGEGRCWWRLEEILKQEESFTSVVSSDTWCRSSKISVPVKSSASSGDDITPPMPLIQFSRSLK